MALKSGSGKRGTPNHAQAFAPDERLVFTHERASVPNREHVVALSQASKAPTFATAKVANPRDWGYAGLLGFTAVLLARPQEQIPGLTSLHLAEVFSLVGIAPMVLHRLARQKPVFRVTRETIGLLAFGLVILGTVPFSIWPGGAMGVFTDAYLKLFVVFVLMMNTLTTPKRIEQMTWLIVLCCGLIAAESVIAYARGQHLVEGNRLAGPVGGIFSNPNDLAANFVTFLPAVAIVALNARASVLRRLIAAGIAALMLATIVFTKSRGGTLGLVTALFALVVLGRKIRPGFSAMAVLIVLAAMPMMPSTYWNRMASIFDEKSDQQQFTGSRAARWTLMQEGMRAFVDHPITGVGAGQFQNYNPPERAERWNETHNALLQVAAETGVFGLLAFAYLIVCAFRAASAVRSRVAPRAPDPNDPLSAVMTDGERHALFDHSVAMSAGLIGWFICSLFASVAYNWTFYYMLALSVAARELVQDRLALVIDPAALATKRRRAVRSRTAGQYQLAGSHGA